MEIVIIAVIILFILIYNKTIDEKKFINDNKKYFEILREDDYNFLVFAKYGDSADPNVLFQKRITYAIATFFIFMFLFIDDVTLINIILSCLIAIAIFKMPYMQLKKYYKAHLHQIDIMLPYYLKSLEILIQHYSNR